MLKAPPSPFKIMNVCKTDVWMLDTAKIITDKWIDFQRSLVKVRSQFTAHSCTKSNVAAAADTRIQHSHLETIYSGSCSDCFHYNQQNKHSRPALRTLGGGDQGYLQYISSWGLAGIVIGRTALHGNESIWCLSGCGEGRLQL